MLYCKKEYTMGKGRIPDFNAIYHAFNWRPIFGCPGRFVLKEEKNYTVRDLTKGRIRISVCESTSAPDTVYIAVLPDGGIISYEKKDGSFVHTLNTKPGFLKKLEKLHISLHALQEGEY